MATRGRTITQREIRDVFLLLGVPLFAGLTAEELVPVVGVGQEVRLNAWEALYRQGEAGTHLYVIIEGSLSLLRRGQEVEVVGKRGYLGELVVLDGGEQLEDAVAREPVVLLAIPGEAFERLLLTYPTLAQTVLSALAKRLREGSTA